MPTFFFFYRGTYFFFYLHCGVPKRLRCFAFEEHTLLIFIWVILGLWIWPIQFLNPLYVMRQFVDLTHTIFESPLCDVSIFHPLAVCLVDVYLSDLFGSPFFGSTRRAGLFQMCAGFRWFWRIYSGSLFVVDLSRLIYVEFYHTIWSAMLRV